MPAGGVGACPDNEPTRQATRQHTRSHRCEGCRRAVRGLAAVPVGGGGAWPGFEIDHSEPSGSCVAISRAGRRPRAHKAARPGAAARATGVNLAGHGQA